MTQKDIDQLKERNKILEERCKRYRSIIRDACDIYVLRDLLNKGGMSVNDYRYLHHCSEMKEVDENTFAAKSKPPLGVMPRDIWDRKRQEELTEAMARYLEAGMKIPSKWLDEYNEISERWEEKER